MKKLILIILTLSALSGFSIDKSDVTHMLKQFKSQNLLNGNQTKDALSQLKKITPEQWNKIRAIAGKVQIKNGNKRVGNSLDSAAQLVDTKSPEFRKLTEELKKSLGR